MDNRNTGCQVRGDGFQRFGDQEGITVPFDFQVVAWIQIEIGYEPVIGAKLFERRQVRQQFQDRGRYQGAIRMNRCQGPAIRCGDQDGIPGTRQRRKLLDKLRFHGRCCRQSRRIGGRNSGG